MKIASRNGLCANVRVDLSSDEVSKGLNVWVFTGLR